jgi:hypothetical protein
MALFCPALTFFNAPRAKGRKWLRIVFFMVMPIVGLLKVNLKIKD